MTGPHIIRGLKWARKLDGWPLQIPQPSRSKRGAKALGIAYELRLAKSLGKWDHGVWWAYEDAEGLGWCQTDFVGEANGWVAILEAKYTWTPDAERQLRLLYVPVVARALRKPESQILPIVVCRNLAPGIRRIVRPSLSEALELAVADARPSLGSAEDLMECHVWHHLGGVPLLRNPRLADPSRRLTLPDLTITAVA